MPRILDDRQVDQQVAQALSGQQPAPDDTQPKGAVARRQISLADWDNIVRQPDTEEKDKYYVPKNIIPDGFALGWKRASTHGKEDREHMAEVKRKAWRPVPSDLDGFAEYFAAFVNETNGTIEIGGSILMIRPKKFDDEARAEQNKKAKLAVHEKMAEMGMTENKDMPRKVHALERSYESNSGIAVPD